MKFWGEKHIVYDKKLFFPVISRIDLQALRAPSLSAAAATASPSPAAAAAAQESAAPGEAAKLLCTSPTSSYNTTFIHIRMTIFKVFLYK